jgi:hypothetical protein
VTEQGGVLDRAPGVHPDLGHARVGELLPESRADVEARRALARLARAARQVLFDVGLHRGGHLVALAARGGAEQHLDPLDRRARLPHGLQRGGHDAHARADPAGVHGADDARLRIGEQDRYAVGAQRDEREPRLGGDERVGGLDRVRPRAGHDLGVAAVDLFHPDQPVPRQAELVGQPVPVGRHRGRVVADTGPEVEGLVGRPGPATGTGRDNPPDPQ